MAYDKDKLEELALKAIKKHKITSVTYVVAYLPCSRKTFNNHELHKLHTIKECLYKNKIDKKTKILNKWQESDNPTLSIAAFKLLADNDELERLNVQKVHQTTEFKIPELKWNE